MGNHFEEFIWKKTVKTFSVQKKIITLAISLQTILFSVNSERVFDNCPAELLWWKVKVCVHQELPPLLCI